MLQKPLLMDPVNPFTNVADPQAHLRRKWQLLIHGTLVKWQRESNLIQFARLETNDSSSCSAMNLGDGSWSHLSEEFG